MQGAWPHPSMTAEKLIAASRRAAQNERDVEAGYLAGLAGPFEAGKFQESASYRAGYRRGEVIRIRERGV